MSLNIHKLALAHERSHTHTRLLSVHLAQKKALSTSLICHACLSALVLAGGGTAIAQTCDSMNCKDVVPLHRDELAPGRRQYQTDMCPLQLGKKACGGRAEMLTPTT